MSYFIYPATASATIAAGSIVNADISASAAIDFSKLATLTSTNILVGSAGNVATSVAVTGDVTISNTGVTAIGATKVTNAMLAGSIAYSKLTLTGAILNADLAGSIAYSKLTLTDSILNADINSAAAIAGTKVSPSFGSQNIITTGRLRLVDTVDASSSIAAIGNRAATANGVLSGATQQGIAVDFTASSAATTAVYGGKFFVRSENASFTIPILANIRCDGVTKGASSTITRYASAILEEGTSGTNNAIIADSTSFTAGNWAVILASTNASKLSGPLYLANQGDVSTAADMVRLGSRDISAGNSTLAIGTETAVVSETVVSDRTLQVYINGTVYKLCLKV